MHFRRAKSKIAAGLDDEDHCQERHDHEPLPEGHPFYELENVLLSPHCADNTPDWLDRAMQFFIAQFERFQKRERLPNVVDKRLGY